MTSAYATAAGAAQSTTPTSTLIWVVVLVAVVCVVVVVGVTYYWNRPIMTGVLEVRLRSGETHSVRLHNKRSVKAKVGDGTVTVRGHRDGTDAKMEVSWARQAAPQSAVLSRGGSVAINSVRFQHDNSDRRYLV
ncbi:hypothetical protein AB0J83_42095 [Actinoplanes sp. NPDC049596]|uniref:hypothetical protein n=1 Tax=unclassified Actinoplanes TaxID=2626549 RepID=UPI003435EED1